MDKSVELLQTLKELTYELREFNMNFSYLRPKFEEFDAVQEEKRREEKSLSNAEKAWDKYQNKKRRKDGALV